MGDRALASFRNQDQSVLYAPSNAASPPTAFSRALPRWNVEANGSKSRPTALVGGRSWFSGISH